MSLAASAENTMKFLEVKINDNNDNDNNDNDNENSYDTIKNSFENNNNNNSFDKDKKYYENGEKIFFKSELNDSDDDMVVVILEEDIQTNQDGKAENNTSDDGKAENNTSDDGKAENILEKAKENCCGGNMEDAKTKQEKCLPASTQKYIGIEVYTHLQQTLESQRMYPLMPCNMISSFARVMEYVEYFDLPSEERQKLVVDLMKILAYSNNDYGSRDCFEYFVEHNMIDDIMQTIIDSTKNRFDINRFPHTNRKIVLSCVSLSNRIKIVKPSAKIESIFEEFKLNLCGLKRFFKMREKDESKLT
jgi:hypothetical protein